MKNYNPYLFRACYGGLSNIKDASELFWVLISNLVEQSEMPHKQKEECFAFFWNGIGEDGPASLMWKILTGRFGAEGTDAGLEVRERYALADNVAGLGSFWKELLSSLRTQKRDQVSQRTHFELEFMSIWIKQFREDVLPMIDAMIRRKQAVWAYRSNLDSDQLQQKRAKKVHRLERELKDVQEILEAALQIFWAQDGQKIQAIAMWALDRTDCE